MSEGKSLLSLDKALVEVLKRPVDTACGLVESLLGEPFKIAGSALADQVALWQWRNRVAIFEKAERTLKEKGLSARVLPPEFLLPLIRECGDTADETLQEAWARLLSSAVADDSNQHIGFVHVLRELAATDARVLNCIIATEPVLDEQGYFDRNARLERIANHLGLPTTTVSLSVSNFIRLGLLSAIGSKMSGFGRSFLKACLCRDQDLEEYLEREREIKGRVLIG